MDTESQVCTKCKLLKSIDNSNNLCSLCVEKQTQRRLYGKEYRKLNIEKSREYDKRWKKQHRQDPKNIKYRKQYYTNNIDKIKKNDRLEYLTNQKKELVRSSKKRASKYVLPFDINESYINEIWPKDNVCPICNIPLIVGTNANHNNSPSMDRVIPELGYVRNNILIMSYKANRTKSSATIDDMKIILQNIENNTPIISHKIDDETRVVILASRLEGSKSRQKTNQFRVMHLERSLVKGAEKRTKLTGVEFNITEDYIKSIWPIDNKCPFLNKPFEVGGYQYKYSASIDRIDPTKGYVEGNVQIISLLVNSMKNDLCMNEFESILRALIKECEPFYLNHLQSNL